MFIQRDLNLKIIFAEDLLVFFVCCITEAERVESVAPEVLVIAECDVVVKCAKKTVVASHDTFASNAASPT